MSSEAVRRRTSAGAWLPWAVAAAILALLGWAVADHLSNGASMHGMHSTSEALFRAGTDHSSLRSLLSARLLTAWQLDAVAVAVLVLAAAWYLTGVALANQRNPSSRWPTGRTLSFLVGLGIVGFATNGSIAVYDQVLFSAHMLGHLALVMVAPIFLAMGTPIRLAVAASNPSLSARISRIAGGPVVTVITAPPIALVSYTVVIVASHLTGLMDHVMQITWAGQVEHLVYVLVGYQFFMLIVGDEPIMWRLTTPGKWVLLLFSMAVDTFTGIVLLQATHPIAMLPSSLNVDAVSDTHTGGSIMWFGGDGIMAVIMIALVMSWLNRPEVRTSDEQRGWMEAARRATFTEHTGSVVAPTAADTDFDDDEAARAAYNEWLAKLNRSS